MKRSTPLWEPGKRPANVTDAEAGATILRLATGAQFRLSGPPPAITGESVPRQLVREAVDVLSDLALKTHGARTNPNLSDQGRRTALKDTHNQAVLQTGQLWKAVQGFRKSVTEREQRLYAVEPPNLNQAGAAIRAWECRQHYASLSAEQKSAFLAEIKAGAGQVEELVSALLNSPIAIASEEIGALREVWQQARRDLNPTEAEAIDADVEAAEWAASAIATIAVPITEMMTSVGSPPPVDVFARVSMSPDVLGFEAFGIAPTDFTRAKQIVEFEGGIAELSNESA